jgi:general secretion pathway protein G
MEYRRVAGSCVKRTSDFGCSRIRFGGSGYTLVELVIVLAIVGVLTAVAIPIYGGYRDRHDQRRAIGDIHVLQTAIERFRTEFSGLPKTLDGLVDPGLVDPWGNPYVYVNLGEPKAKSRKDKNLHPLNSDYDLCSMGKDGVTAIPLTSEASYDDILRASDGAYIGLAIDY